jgi:hypothetical protein
VKLVKQGANLSLIVYVLSYVTLSTLVKLGWDLEARQFNLCCKAVNMIPATPFSTSFPP